MSTVSKIFTPIIKNNFYPTRLIERNPITSVKPEGLRYAHNLAKDEFCRTIPKQHISLEDVKSLFPEGKLENNYIVEEIKDAIKRLKTDYQIIDLRPKLDQEDYEIIHSLMNRDNGRFIEQWKEFSSVDNIPNLQKLALFARTMKLTKQTKDFLEFNPSEWELIYQGIVKKPKDMIMPMLEYKADSTNINKAISENKINHKMKYFIDKITAYLDMFTVKKDFTAYRGDKTFGILSGIKVDELNTNLGKLTEDITFKFQKNYKESNYDINQVKNFVNKYLINKKIYQPRFMSLGMTVRSIKDFARKIMWRITVPKGTKGASIESFNIESKVEAEFLGQRNGALNIKDATYCPKKDIWYFDATLEQYPVDNFIVNC